jgi:predicted transcriptional regulator
MKKELQHLSPYNNFTYQHIHGIMLVNLNKLASELRLSHAEYRVMGLLIGYWNKKETKAFPTVKTMAKQATMSNSTILKSLNSLSQKGLILIVKDGKNGRQSYYLNEKKFLCDQSNTSVTTKKPHSITPCSNSINRTNRYKQNRIKPSFDKTITDSIKTLPVKNDDEIKLSNYPSLNIIEDRHVLEKLLLWGFVDPQKIIKQHGINHIKKMLDVMNQCNPRNPGAYLRTLLKNPENTSLELLNNNIKTTNSFYEKIFKIKYWRHKPTERVFQALPDTGTHILFHYDQEEEKVFFVDEQFSDAIKNFEPVLDSESLKYIKDKGGLRPDKQEIIRELIQKGNLKEASYLKKMWKISL